MKLYGHRRGALGLLAIAAAAVMVAAPQAALAVDFSGKKVTIIVPFKEGGGADTYSRLFQPFLEKYLPGSPTVLVRNQPGGGSVKGANKFDRTAKGDGLTALACSTSSLVNYVIGGKKVKYDVLKWRPVVLSPRGTIFYANPKLGVKGKDVVADIKVLQKSKLNFGAKTPTSSELRAVMAFEMLGIKDVNVVFGLSTGKQRKAFLRGELDINYDSAGTYTRKVVKFAEKGMLVPVFTMGFADASGKIGRDPAFPDVPTVLEGYQKLYGKQPTGHVAAAFTNFLHMGVTASKSIVLPAGTSDEIVNAWINASKMALADPDFQKRAKKVLGAYSQFHGEEAAGLLRMATDVKPETKKWLRAFVKTRFNVDI